MSILRIGLSQELGEPAGAARNSVFITQLVHQCSPVQGQLRAMVDPLTATVQLVLNALPAKVLLDILMVKGTRRKQTQLLNSL